MTGTAHTTCGTPDPREGKGKEKEENLWPGRAIKRKPLSGTEPQTGEGGGGGVSGGAPSRRTGAVALGVAGVKYLCVTDVFIAFSAPQPAGRGLSSSPV